MYVCLCKHKCADVCVCVSVCYVMLLKSYPLLARKLHEDTCREVSKGTSFTMLKTNLDCSAGSSSVCSSF